MDRWNEDRADKPADYMVAKHTKPAKEDKVPVAVKAEKTEETAPKVEETETAPEPAEEEVPAEKPKRGRKPKKKENEE